MTVIPDITSGVDWRYAIRGAQEGSKAYSRKELVQQAQERIEALIKEYVPSGGIAVNTLVKHGTVFKEILDTAEEIKANLIILAAYRPALKDYLLGSNASQVVRHAHCLVMVIRDD